MVFRLQWRGAACAVATLFALGLLLPSGASAVPDAHGHLLHVVKPGLRANATESSNWFGYNQGTLEQGASSSTRSRANWTVPRARQHKKGEAEASSTWIGI